MSVARSIGDVYAKLRQFGGLPNVISFYPDIIRITDLIKQKNVNCIILASDGVYDCFNSNEEILELIKIGNFLSNINVENLQTLKELNHILAAKVVDRLLKKCIKLDCSDNISAIALFFNLGNELKTIEIK